MINSTDFRTGLTIEIDGGVWQIVDFQHVKPGKGAAFVRTKIKNVETGAVVERTFNPNEKMPAAHLETRNMQYLYEADGMYTFMDTETYEQTELNKEQLGDALNYLMENMEVSLQTFKGRIMASSCRTPLTSRLSSASRVSRATRLRAPRKSPRSRRATKSACRSSSTRAIRSASIRARATTSSAHKKHLLLLAAAAPGMFMQLVQQLHFFHFYFVLFSFLAGKSVRVRE